MSHDYPTWPEMYTPPEQRPGVSPEASWPIGSPPGPKPALNSQTPDRAGRPATPKRPAQASSPPAVPKPSPSRNARITKLARARRLVFGGLLATSIGSFATIATQAPATTSADAGEVAPAPISANLAISRSVVVIPVATPSPTAPVGSSSLSAIKEAAAAEENTSDPPAAATRTPEPAATELPTLEPTATDEPPVHTRTKTS